MKRSTDIRGISEYSITNKGLRTKLMLNRRGDLDDEYLGEYGLHNKSEQKVVYFR